MVSGSMVRVFDAESGEFKRLETSCGKPFAWRQEESLVLRLKGGTMAEVTSDILPFPTLEKVKEGK